MTVYISEDVGAAVAAAELSVIEGGISGWCGTTGPVVLPPVQRLIPKPPIIINGPGPDPAPPELLLR